MKVKSILGGAGYKSPVCTPVEVFSEGILCASFGNESFNVENAVYGYGLENNGWNY